MAMELDIIKTDTTWNDAAASLNNNFNKVKLAIAQNEANGGGGSGTGGDIVIDTEMSDTSENAVQNKVIKSYVDESAKRLDYRIEHLERERVFVFDATCSTDPWELNVLQTTTKIEDVVGAIVSNAPIYMQFSEVLVAVSEAYLYSNGDVSLYVYLVDPDSNVARTVHTYATEDSWAWEYYNNTIGGDAVITVDTEMSYESTNPVQNKVVTEYIDKHPQYEVIEEIEVPDLPEGSGGSVDLTGYATEEWVEGKGYATESWVNNQDLADKAYVGSQINAYSSNTYALIAALEERIAALEKMLEGVDGGSGCYFIPAGVTYADNAISVSYDRVGVMPEALNVKTKAKIGESIATKESTVSSSLANLVTIFTIGINGDIATMLLPSQEYTVEITVETSDSNGTTTKSGTFTFTT